MHLRMFGRMQYRLSREKLAQSDHPVAWLRVTILADRVRRMGYDFDAETLERSWATIAATMGIEEEHYGFYAPGFLEPVHQTITDMLIETAPRRFGRRVAEGSEVGAPSSPVCLINRAWRRFQADPNSYPSWEEEAIADFLVGDTTS